VEFILCIPAIKKYSQVPRIKVNVNAVFSPDSGDHGVFFSTPSIQTSKMINPVLGTPGTFDSSKLGVLTLPMLIIIEIIDKTYLKRIW
jgi:hypothetical protein